MKKCKYYSEHPRIEGWTPACTNEQTMHPQDIVGDYCPFCGGKIKFKPGEKRPSHD